MFCPVMFLVLTLMPSLKSNERSTIFVWKLSLDVALNTHGERQTGNCEDIHCSMFQHGHVQSVWAYNNHVRPE